MQTPLQSDPASGKVGKDKDTTGCGQQVGGTHPTGMHTCTVKNLDVCITHFTKKKKKKNEYFNF